MDPGPAALQGVPLHLRQLITALQRGRSHGGRAWKDGAPGRSWAHLLGLWDSAAQPGAPTRRQPTARPAHVLQHLRIPGVTPTTHLALAVTPGHTCLGGGVTAKVLTKSDLSEEACPVVTHTHTHGRFRPRGDSSLSRPHAGGTLNKAPGARPPWTTAQHLQTPAFSGEVSQGGLPTGGGILLGLERQKASKRS